jgi:hypothetical protein
MKNGRALPISIIVVALVMSFACGGGGGGGSGAAVSTAAAPYVTNGLVYTVAVANDGTTCIGGTFTQAGPATGSFLPLDGTTGAASSCDPDASGPVHALVAYGSKVYAGGSFIRIGTEPLSSFARIDR